MSNFDGAKFVTVVAKAWIGSGKRRLPDANEVRTAFRTCLRGKAQMSHEIDIELEGMIDNFQVVGKEACRIRDDDFIDRMIASFAREASDRLDHAVCKSQPTLSTDASSPPSLEA